MKSANEPDSLALEPVPPAPAPLVPSSQPSPLSILEAAIRGGVTAENVSVVKELMQMCREQRAEDAKSAFARAFFNLRKNMPVMYADREAKNKAGEVTFTYCSEKEIAAKLEPHLQAYGFAPLFGQSEKDGRITISFTLMHEQGHSEVREFTVRAGTPNAMKDAAMCDTGAATTAWRHLMMKMFNLQSRIQANQDAAIEGERITPDKVQWLKEQVAEQARELGRDATENERRFLQFAGVKSYEEITEATYPLLTRSLASKRKA